MKLLIPFLLGAGLTCAQNTPPLEIRGTVTEAGVGLAGVTVTLYEFGDTPALATTRSISAITSTDAKGQYTFNPVRAGEYYVEAQKDGYFAESFNGPTADPADSAGEPVSIDFEHPVREQKFSLMRLGELRGRVIDEDGQPIANLRVMLRPVTSTQVVTDRDGYFVAAKLRPGDYLVGIVPRNGPEILPEFSEGDLKIVDQDLETWFSPSVTLPVRAWASLTVGTITARKTFYYRAHLSVLSSDCAEGEKWNFSPRVESAGVGSLIPCGKEFLVRNLAPGLYTFTLSSGRPGETRRLAIAPVEVGDHNLHVAIRMLSGADINGRMVTLEGAALPPSGRTKINVAPMSGLPVGIQYIAPDAAGKFLIRGLSENRHRVSVDGLDKFYVKEIRYNGVAAVDGIITPIAGAAGQLEIMIDDKAATIGGSVAGLSKATGRVMVVAVKWPVPADATSPQALLSPGAIASADDQGRFQIGGLAPGEYRIVALAEGISFRLSAENLIQLANRAEKVTLERGGSQSVSLKITEP